MSKKLSRGAERRMRKGVKKEMDFKKVKKVVGMLALGAVLFMDAGMYSKAVTKSINNIKVVYGCGEAFCSKATKNVSYQNGFVDLTEDVNGRWITAKMKKNGTIYGIVTLKEGERKTMSNSGVANTKYSLYISRTNQGNNSTSYVNGCWSPDNQ